VNDLFSRIIFVAVGHNVKDCGRVVFAVSNEKFRTKHKFMTTAFIFSIYICVTFFTKNSVQTKKLKGYSRSKSVIVLLDQMLGAKKLLCEMRQNRSCHET